MSSVVIGLVLACTFASADAVLENPHLAAYVGRWQIDVSLSPGRSGPGGGPPPSDSTYTFVLTPEGSALRMEVFSEFPLPAPSRSMPLAANGKLQGCPGPAPCLSTGGSAAEQAYAWYELDDRVLARIFYVKSQVYEYSTLALAADGQYFTLISWQPGTPQYQNIRTFRKMR